MNIMFMDVKKARLDDESQEKETVELPEVFFNHTEETCVFVFGCSASA